MRTQAEQLARLARQLRVEVLKQEYFDTSRVQINDYVDVYANDVKDYIHVQFNRHGKPVDITIHDYNETHYSESLNIDLSIIDHELDKIVQRSKTVVDEFIDIFANRSEEIKQQKIRDLEAEIAKLRGDI
jgi:hypothetical protein